MSQEAPGVREENGECVLSTVSRPIKFTTTLRMSIAPIHLNDDGVIFPVSVHFLDLHSQTRGTWLKFSNRKELGLGCERNRSLPRPANREQQEVRKMGISTLAHRNEFMKLLTRQQPLPPHNIVS